MVTADEDSVLFIYEADDGFLVRRVGPASNLPDSLEHGTAAETATRGLAGLWGLPDFVYQPRQSRTGSGVRELGDAVLSVNDIAAVVQVKARTAPSTNRARETSWLDKHIKEAERQAKGTIRRLSTQSSVTLRNLRGRDIQLDCTSKTWVHAVVIDHPGLDGYVPPCTTTLLRRDWDFLFEQLKSTHAVLEYMQRITDTEPIGLGAEVARYYGLAQADLDAPPHPLDAGELEGRVQHASGPSLPRTPAGHDSLEYHSVLRRIQEDIATAPRPQGLTEEDFIEVLAAIDSLPVGHRSDLGQLLLNRLPAQPAGPGELPIPQIRSILGAHHAGLLFVTLNQEYDEHVQTAITGLALLRHEQLGEIFPWYGRRRMTVVVCLTPRADGLGRWDTTVAATRGQAELTSDDRATLEAFWGRPGQAPTGLS